MLLAIVFSLEWVTDCTEALSIQYNTPVYGHIFIELYNMHKKDFGRYNGLY